MHRDTVALLLVAVSKVAKKQNERTRKKCSPKIVILDEMETFEHSKCKPVSIVGAVEEKTRKILALEAAYLRQNPGPHQAAAAPNLVHFKAN